MISVEDYRPGMLAEALQSGKTSCSTEVYGHGMRTQAQPGSSGYKQIASSVLKKCELGVGQTNLGVIKYIPCVKHTIYTKFRHNLKTIEERERCKKV